MDFLDLLSIFCQALLINAVALFAHQAFAGELEEDSIEFHIKLTI